MNGKTSVENFQSMFKECELLPRLQEKKHNEVKR